MTIENNEQPLYERLKHARRVLRRNQRAAAKILEVSFATYNRWEKGHTLPQPDRLARVQRFIELAAKMEAQNGN